MIPARLSLAITLASALCTGNALAQPMAPLPEASGLTPARPTAIQLDAGVGRVVQMPAAAATVIAADPRVARVQPLSPTSLFIMAVSGGRTTVIATAEDGRPIAQFEVNVRAAASEVSTGGLAPTVGPAGAAAPALLSGAAIEAAIRRAVPAVQALSVTATPGAILLDGRVATPEEAQRAFAMAQGLGGEGRKVVNQLVVLGSTQVNVRVRIAEISRQVTRELGLNWQALGSAGSFAFGLRSGPSANSVAGAIASGSTILGGVGTAARFAAGVSTGRLDLNAVIDALAADQLVSILAEPNLTAQTGETASFLAGGEFPVPVAATTTGQISVQFKPFGVSLAFVPTVLSPDRLSLRVRPEVSELSQNGAISMPLTSGSVTIPALTVRRAETTIELGSGQSFAIAGLLQRSTTQLSQGVAGLGDLPVIGALFRSNAFLRDETELVIIVTPYVVRPVSDPGALASPADGFRPATDLDRLLFQRQLANPGTQPAALPRLDAGFILE
jgi:pilus assembly protein CpaC